jgi:hypothetical protein
MKRNRRNVILQAPLGVDDAVMVVPLIVVSSLYRFAGSIGSAIPMLSKADRAMQRGILARIRRLFGFPTRLGSGPKITIASP